VLVAAARRVLAPAPRGAIPLLRRWGGTSLARPPDRVRRLDHRHRALRLLPRPRSALAQRRLAGVAVVLPKDCQTWCWRHRRPACRSSPRRSVARPRRSMIAGLASSYPRRFRSPGPPDRRNCLPTRSGGRPMGKAGLAFVRARFSFASQAEKYLQLFDRLGVRRGATYRPRERSRAAALRPRTPNLFAFRFFIGRSEPAPGRRRSCWRSIQSLDRRRVEPSLGAAGWRVYGVEGPGARRLPGPAVWV